MRKRYSKEDLEYLEEQAKLGTPCDVIGEALGVSHSAVKHALSRRGIKFCRTPIVPIPGEVWAPCSDVPDVEVSDKGRFRRVSSDSLIAGYTTTGGYTTVDFSGVGSFSAHRLIAQTFLPNPENKPEVNHKDGVKANNDVCNLEWVTPTENMRHAIRTGLKVAKSGQEHHRTALTEQQILDCVQQKADGKTFEEIGDQYGVNRKTVSRHVNQYRRSTERSEAIPQGSRE